MALLCEADQAGMRCRSEWSLEQCLDINTGSCALSGYHRESAAFLIFRNALPGLESELWMSLQSLGKDWLKRPTMQTYVTFSRNQATNTGSDLSVFEMTERECRV